MVKDWLQVFPLLRESLMSALSITTLGRHCPQQEEGAPHADSVCWVAWLVGFCCSSNYVISVCRTLVPLCLRVQCTGDLAFLAWLQWQPSQSLTKANPVHSRPPAHNNTPTSLYAYPPAWLTYTLHSSALLTCLYHRSLLPVFPMTESTIQYPPCNPPFSASKYTFSDQVWTTAWKGTLLSLSCLFGFVVLEIEFRASCLLGKFSPVCAFWGLVFQP
jgi:hypothetical protein